MGKAWDSDETVDYTVEPVDFPAGSGPRATWPEHTRIGLFCSVCGLLQAWPRVTGLVYLMLSAAEHHHAQHDGPPVTS